MGRRLAGKVCVVTGATGMAAAAARRIADEGGAVFIISLPQDAEDAGLLVADIAARSGQVAWHPADLRDEEETRAAFGIGVARFGRIDGLFAVAGASARRQGDGPAHQASAEGFRAALEGNAVPAFLAARYALLAMLAQAPGHEGARGSIILMSSVVAQSPSTRFATHGYAAAKGAIDALTRALAAQYAVHGIRVNALAPGLVATPMSGRARGDAATMAYIALKQPLAGGPLPAEAVADLAVFLLSDEARYLTGQVIAVDGGWSVTEAPGEPGGAGPAA
jgi:NAD(P)-dependent dehydrogenase (short-subunit alcohol dehydrogenase family)